MLFVVTWLTLKVVWAFALCVSLLAVTYGGRPERQDGAIWTGLRWFFIPVFLTLTAIFLTRGLWT